MKKFFTPGKIGLFLAIIIAISFLVACGAPAPAPVNPTPASTQTPWIVDHVVTATPAPATPTSEAPAPTATNVPSVTGTSDSKLAEDHFTTQGIQACYPVNFDWKKLFGQPNGTYKIDPGYVGFDTNNLYKVEGVITGTNPVHSVFTLVETVTMDQANIWDCKLKSAWTKEADHTNSFDFTDKKYVNQTVQGLSKPYHVVTVFGVWDYATGEKPAWSPNVPDTLAPVCPFYAPAKSDPAGAIQTTEGFVGAPGKAGCDFVLLSVDGKTATRYHGPIDVFPYQEGSHFYLFDPTLTNTAVSTGIPGNPTVTNSWK